MRVEVHLAAGQRGGLGGLHTLLVVLSAGGMHSTLVLLLTPTFCSRLFRSGSRGSLVFLCLLFICWNCAWKKVKVTMLWSVWLSAAPWTVAHQAPPSMGFPRQEYWSGLPFPSPGDIPNPGIEPRSPALQADTLTSEPPGNCAYLQLFLIPYSFLFVFVCSRRGVSSCKHCSCAAKGPRSQPVSGQPCSSSGCLS